VVEAIATSSMRPLSVTLKSATGLKGVRGNESNPLVIVSAVSEMGAEFEQEYQRLSSTTTGNSQWAKSADWNNEEIILPGVLATVTCCSRWSTLALKGT